MKELKLVDAQFLTSAQKLQDSPPPNRAEIAFLGRSNVGKSSLLNSLTKKVTKSLTIMTKFIL
jgi:GTP-binding protein